MSVWTTKKSVRDRKYVVIKHKLKNIDYSINGIKFRGGYAVVEKDSKLYFTLKKISLLKGCEEYPLVHLRKLPFITRTSDVKMVYGQDVYAYYLKELEQELHKEEVEAVVEAETKHVEEQSLCCYRGVTKALCANEAAEVSPSGYCLFHILKDPKLEEFGLKVPPLTKSEVKEFKKKVISKLTKLKNSGSF